MKTYIALLRGINVSGQKIIKMQELREAIEAMGFADVRTYVQSGNIVFKSAAKPNAELAQMLSKQIAKTFGFDVPVVVRSAEEWTIIAKSHPLLKQSQLDVTKLYVTFLNAAPTANATRALQLLANEEEQCDVIGHEVYLHCPKVYGNTKLSNANIEKKLGVSATTRNWKTVNALLEMVGES
jgi:uncharacterized protein (DUF1697 family)